MPKLQQQMKANVVYQGFLNARILIHRPFLVASTSAPESGIVFAQHINPCLSAARACIQAQYESLLHRLYIRTWFVTYRNPPTTTLHVFIHPSIHQESNLANNT